MGDLDLLVDMGFDKERASLALKKGGDLQSAIDWLENNQEKSLDDIKAEEQAGKLSESQTDPTSLEGQQEARSLVCNECGKMFRTPAQAEFHASKTEHTDFSESVEEIAPLGPEEKQAKLDELKRKLAEKRSEQTTKEKEEAKMNEEIRRKSTREGQDIRDALQTKERIKEAEKKRREKREDDLARKRILDQIERDKADRKRKAEAEKAARAGVAPPQPTETEKKPPVQTAPKPAAAYSDARLRLQMPTAMITKSFPAESTLFEVAYAVKEEAGFEVSSFTTNFPKKTFEVDDFGMTLKEAGMVPSAALILK